MVSRFACIVIFCSHCSNFYSPLKSVLDALASLFYFILFAVVSKKKGKLPFKYDWEGKHIKIIYTIRANHGLWRASSITQLHMKQGGELRSIHYINHKGLINRYTVELKTQLLSSDNQQKPFLLSRLNQLSSHSLLITLPGLIHQSIYHSHYSLFFLCLFLPD